MTEAKKSEIAVSKLADRLVAAAESGDLGLGFTMREALKRHWGGATADAMAGALNCAVVDGRLELRKVTTAGRPRFGYFISAASRDARLVNAESDRLDAIEEAECAAEDRDGYRRELARVRAQLRETEAALRAERHEHAETRESLARYESEGVSPAIVRALGNLSRAVSSAKARQTAPFTRTRDSEAWTGKDEGEGTNARPGANAGGCEVNP